MGQIGGEDFLVTTGNPLNQVHLVNLGGGLAGNYGLTQWQVGYTQPLNTGDRKPFDFEVHAALNRHF